MDSRAPSFLTPFRKTNRSDSVHLKMELMRRLTNEFTLTLDVVQSWKRNHHSVNDIHPPDMDSIAMAPGLCGSISESISPTLPLP